MAEKQQKKIPLPVLSYAVRLFMVGRGKWEPNPFLSNISKAARFCDREKSTKLNKNRKNCIREKKQKFRLQTRLPHHYPWFFCSLFIFFSFTVQKTGERKFPQCLFITLIKIKRALFEPGALNPQWF